MSHKEPLRISVSKKDAGEVSSFISEYTMHEHFDGIPERHGVAVARYVEEIREGNYIVSIHPLPDDKLKKAVMKHLGVTGLEPGQFVMDAVVINPFQLAYRYYEIVSLDDHAVAISKPHSFGYRYGKIIPEWVEEYNSGRAAEEID